MSEHTSVVFNNSCVTIPRNPSTHLPSPLFERKHAMSSKKTEGNVIKSFIEFYDSIPEYDDINHLSNKEFYKKLDGLKEMQRCFYDYLHHEKDSDWLGEKEMKKKKKAKTKVKKSARVSPLFSEKALLLDNTSDDFTDSNRDFPLSTKSAPSSPRGDAIGVGWKEDGITIPKPFKMTVRDEENKIIDEVMLSVKKQPKEGSISKPEMFKANPVPIESQIPLYNTIVTAKEERSRAVKRRSKENLLSQMRPFSFTRRDEEIQAITKRLSKSYPCVYNETKPFKPKSFKAKPIPKGLFSNYVYKKMHEDEFYRALQRKIRAEEMLKAASLPPAMKSRERSASKLGVCSKAASSNDSMKSQSHHRIPNYKASHERLEKELKDLKNEFITTSPRPFSLKTSKRNEKRLRKCYGGSSRNSSAASKTTESSAADLLSVNKSNLASVLRIQSAKKRLEMEMCKKLEEAKLMEETRWREKVLRKRPAWQGIAYSHEEDLAIRLQLRKDEARIRDEQHRHVMELMYGRVDRIPTLFERQTTLKKSTTSSASKVQQPKLDKDYAKLVESIYSPNLTMSDTSENASSVVVNDKKVSAKEMMKEILGRENGDHRKSDGDEE